MDRPGAYHQRAVSNVLKGTYNLSGGQHDLIIDPAKHPPVAGLVWMREERVPRDIRIFPIKLAVGHRKRLRGSRLICTRMWGKQAEREIAAVKHTVTTSR